MNFLIIDQSKLHFSVMEKLLNEEGYRNIQWINDPTQALGEIESVSPDLIILDLNIPQIDGLAVMNRLKDYRDKHYLPLLALTEDKSSEYRLRALQSGATDLIVKPYENLEFLIRIRNMVEMRMLHMQVQDQNKILEYKVNERTKELRSSQLEVIRRLAQAAEFRDHDTGLHIIRMSQYCATFAEYIGMNLEQVELILNASALHDVGKIGISDSILLKPGKLTIEEFEIMKTHTTIGARILAGSSTPVMKLAETIALTHHEKWDGTGYPNQLKGKEIPIEGQICSLCDVFDALTSKRPYKKAWSVEEAIDELIQQKKHQFDDQMVDHFVDIMPKIVGIKEKYAEQEYAANFGAISDSES